MNAVLQPNDPAAIRPFQRSVPETELIEMRKRINATRWPEQEPITDAPQRVSLATLQKLAGYWGTEYDWRPCAARLSALPQFITEIDGVDIHFVHVRSKHENALPIIVTHGWPGSLVEQLKIIDPLTNPTAHGASASDAFHVVIPSRPGCGFSGKPASAGWDCPHIAQACSPPTGLGLDESRAFERLAFFFARGLSYAQQMATHPVALCGIGDSPVGLAAWFLDNELWSDELLARAFEGQGEGLTRDDLLDNITFTWLTNTAISSARLYRENRLPFFAPMGVTVPIAVSAFPDETFQVPRSWAERAYPRLIHYNKVAKGGHFAAWEQPGLLSEEVRAGFRSLRNLLPDEHRAHDVPVVSFGGRGGQ